MFRKTLQQLYSMGNQNRKTEGSGDGFHEQLGILKWRADVQHNTNIARTVLLTHSQTSSMAFQKVITSQLSQKAFIDLANLQQIPSQGERSSGKAEFLVFEEYVGTLVVMEDCLSMEENIYVLITLLFGYEKIYEKIGKACVHETCCHLTASGEVRAWVNSDPTSCQLDQKLIKQDGKDRLVGGTHGGKILCTTQASICKSILAMVLRLSDKSHEFIRFHRQVDIFIKSNVLQNANFAAIRRFINGFIYRNRLSINNNIFSAMERIQNRNQILSPKAKCQHVMTHSQQFSLKSCKIQLPLEEQHPLSNLQQRMPELHFQSSQLSHHQPRQSLVSQKKSLKRTDKSIQTSQILYKQQYNHCLSTQMQTPKKSNYISANNQLICSEIIMAKEMERYNGQQRTQKSKLFKENDPSKLSKRMNVDDDSSEEKRSVIFKPRFGSNGKKLVRFHSHHPSYDEDNFNSLCQQPVLPEKQMDFCTHYSLTRTHNPHIKRDQDPAQSQNNRSEFSNSKASSKQMESRALTRVVNRLVSNKQIDLCQSVGSFQSFQNGSNSGYSGILLGMGRSVEIINEPAKKRTSSNYRGFSSIAHNPAAHMTF